MGTMRVKAIGFELVSMYHTTCRLGSESRLTAA
jgi:hypothetical protein